MRQRVGTLGEHPKPAEVYQAYMQRYDLEHFFRFGQQRLLLASYQTPDAEHEENWGQLAQLAHVQLWLARTLADTLPRPWERYLPTRPSGVASPTTTQRDFGRIIRQIGTPAAAPKRRGNSPGRAKGTRLEPRKRQPVVEKGEKVPKAVRNRPGTLNCQSTSYSVQFSNLRLAMRL